MRQNVIPIVLLMATALIAVGCVDDNSADAEGGAAGSAHSGSDATAMGGGGEGGQGGAVTDAAAVADDSGSMSGDEDARLAAPDAAVIVDMERPEPDAMVVQRRLSFFVTSLDAMRRLSGSQDGFGGDFGGLAGADEICQTIAEGVGVGAKTWRAFLSVTRGEDGNPVHAIERIGEGPWYDANDRLVAQNIQGLLGERPDGDAQTINDLPDENGVPISALGDAHDIVTGSNQQGRLDSTNPASTCNDWTSADGNVGGDLIKCGHSFPRMARGGGGRPGGGGGRPNRGGGNWVSDHTLRGCAPGVELRQTGGGQGLDFIGASGGYGGLYCFSVAP
jgi:hypothetical protein